MVTLPAETLLEAIDGPTAVGTLEGKWIPVLTRLPDGRLGFRMMGKFAKAPAPAPMVRVSFENGQTVRIGATQALLRKDGSEVRAVDLAAGDAVARAFHYRDGYRPPDLPDLRESDGTLLVTSVASDGEAEAFTAPVRETGRFFLTCGALLKA